MAYGAPKKVKLSRQLDLALTPRAAKWMGRRPYPPGQHGAQSRRRKKASDYKLQLLEKQRLRAQYNLRERQLRNTVKKAIRTSGNAEDNIVRHLETRLDAFVHRSGLARTIYAARQYVGHRHILVNGKRVGIPSYRIKVGDVVSVKEKSREIPCFVAAAEEMAGRAPDYIERSREEMSARLVFLPKREQVPVSCDTRFVIEYYSRR